MSEVKQLKLQIKERDARISQLEASEKHWKTQLEALEAAVLKNSEIIHYAKEIVTAYTAALNILAAIAEQAKENSGQAEA